MGKVGADKLYMQEEKKIITLGFSPCPNDTYIFNGLVNGSVRLPGCDIREHLHDIETLNSMAFEGHLDVSKLSFYAWLMVKEDYRMLNSGGALGFGCGPVVVSQKPLTREDMEGCRIALPGQWTTAHLLFRLWSSDAGERLFVPYDRIFEAIRSGQADCGVIIHESRFTYEQLGFQKVIDLGAWWEENSGGPIPLGCIAAHKRIGPDLVGQMDRAIGKSIRAAQADPMAALPYIKTHAQEMTPEVLDAHIQTFVNEFSLDIGAKGRSAVKALEAAARETGILP
ncbi:MAG: 1,4-dihydroxy-6-naphthoate synthase [Desulfobacteraceae bacterium]|jgi:1,4-dihydroxy-6-naphthoate synthase